MTKSQISKTRHVSLTTQAANKLKTLQKKTGNSKWGLRFADKRGLCGSGYEYILDIATAPQLQDEVFYSNGIPIYVPKESLNRLQGSVIEYHGPQSLDEEFETLEKKGFVVMNPNVKGPCPCACHKGVDL